MGHSLATRHPIDSLPPARSTRARSRTPRHRPAASIDRRKVQPGYTLFTPAQRVMVRSISSTLKGRSSTGGRCRTRPAYTPISSPTAISSMAGARRRRPSASRCGRSSRAAPFSRSTGTATSSGRSAIRTIITMRACCATATSSSSAIDEVPDRNSPPASRAASRASEVEGGRIFSDALYEITTDGQVVWEWHAWEHLDPAIDVITPPGPPPRVEPRQHRV